jgi:hypothetical protein
MVGNAEGCRNAWNMFLRTFHLCRSILQREHDEL